MALVKKTIAADLSYLATARQGQVDPIVLSLYYEALKEFPLDEIRTAIKDLARTPRCEGETAMPDLGTVLAAVRYAGRFRIVEEARRKQNEELRHREEHPEEYVAVRDIFAAAIEKQKARFPELAAKNPEPARCPHCEGVLPTSATLSKMSAADHRSVADAMDRRAQQGGRMTRLLELEPRYSAVTVARWEAATGKKALLLGT